MNHHSFRKECGTFISHAIVGLSIVFWLMIGLTAIIESESRLLSDVLLIGFGGVKPIGQIHLLGLFRWLGSLLPYVTITLIGFRRSMTHIVYTLPRIGKAGTWWRQKVIALSVWSILYFIIGLLVVVLLCVISQIKLDALPTGILLYPVMLLVSGMILCSISLFFSQMATISIFVAVWGITAVLGNKADRFLPILYGCFGMALQVNRTTDFIIVFIVQCGVICALWVIGGKLLKASLNYKKTDC